MTCQQCPTKLATTDNNFLTESLSVLCFQSLCLLNFRNTFSSSRPFVPINVIWSLRVRITHPTTNPGKSRRYCLRRCQVNGSDQRNYFCSVFLAACGYSQADLWVTRKRTEDLLCTKVIWGMCRALAQVKVQHLLTLTKVRRPLESSLSPQVFRAAAHLLLSERA